MKFRGDLSNELTHKGFDAHLKVEDEALEETLHTYWGKERNFRQPPVASLDQKAIIKRVFAQKDQLVIAATGGGKSLCFQLPAILLAQDIIPKVTLVISPLIALMQDQVDALNQSGIFSAISLNSTASHAHKSAHLRGIKQGDYSIIYLAPEQVYSAALRNVLRQREIGLIAVDEAHCLSQWGHSFRTSYFQLQAWIKTQLCQNHERTFPLLALTATARKGYKTTREKSTVEDIIERLGLQLQEEEVTFTSPERPEIQLHVERISVPCPYCGYASYESGEVRCKNEGCQKRFHISKEQIWQNKIQKLIEFLKPYVEDGLDTIGNQIFIRRHQRGIIYCRTRLETENVCAQMRQVFSSSLRIDYYHAGREEERERIARQFLSNEDGKLDIVVATNAFGMGIDARLLGFVVHFDVPATLEAYYQEAGRAGRDKYFTAENRAQCVLLYHQHDLEGQRWLTSQNSINDQDIELTYKALTQIRGSKRSAIMVKASQIQHLTDLNENQISSILYYLEHYTIAHDKPVLARRENGTQCWQLKFEADYQERINDPDLALHSRQLADAFCHSQQFALNKESTVIIDIEELAASLGWDQDLVKAEKRNLLGRRIIVEANEEYILWKQTKDECLKRVEQLIATTWTLLQTTNNQTALWEGRPIDVALPASPTNARENSVKLPESIFMAFLDALSKKNAGDFCLFSTFIPQPLSHKATLCLSPSLDEALNMQTRRILHLLRQRLTQIVEHFSYEVLSTDTKQQSNNTRYINLLDVAPDYLERRQFELVLRLLQTADLLTILRGKQREVDMHVAFLQQDVSPHDLKIDLSTLRLVERYGKRKLDLMHEYAMSVEEERKRLLHDYFFGHKPLIEPFIPHSALTQEQSALVTLSEGYHLIQAPAGSGKSFVLQEHLRYLVEHLQVPNDRILVTAQQHGTLNRLDHQVETVRNTDRSIPSKTLQSLAAGIFKSERNRLVGIDQHPYFPADKEVHLLKGHQSYKEQQELAMVSDALIALCHSHNELIRQHWPAGLQFPQLPERYQRHRENETRYFKVIKLFRSSGIFPAHISAEEEIRFPLQHVLAKSLWLRENLSMCYAAYISYQLLQRERGLYTFEDQILFALAILQASPEIAEQWQRKYEHIIIDEFQDLTPAASKLLGKISSKHQNVFAVGDGTQRINIDFYGETAPAHVFGLMDEGIHASYHFLTTNFRSVQEILNLARAIPDLPRFYTQSQTSFYGEKGCKPQIIYLKREASSHPGEKDIIQAMVDVALNVSKKLSPEDTGSVALLAAKVNLSDTIQNYLYQKGVPFTVLDHRYQSLSVKRYLAYLRLIQDRQQTDVVEFFLSHCLSPYFTSNQVARLKTYAEQLGQSLLEIALDPVIHMEIKADAELLPTLQKHISLIQHYTITSQCDQLWTPIKELWKTEHAEQKEGEQDEETTDEDEKLTSMLEELGPKTVRQALEHVDHFISSIEENRSERKLVVTTVDNAKSQDFDTVFLIGADWLKEARRWYVSVTRARQRFFALMEASSSNTHGIVCGIPKQWYDARYFSDDLEIC